MNYEFVDYEMKERIAIIRMNRPERLNSMSQGIVRDLNQAWWVCGISDVYPTLSDLFDRLLAETQGAKRIVTLGSSAGGFGALLFGSMLDADLTIAFAPQTFMDRETRKEKGERRWGYQIETIYERTADPGLLNLRGVIAPRRAVVYMRRDCPADLAHAENLDGIKNVEINLIDGPAFKCVGPGCMEPCKGHDAAMALKEAGKIQRLIEGAVNA